MAPGREWVVHASVLFDINRQSVETNMYVPNLIWRMGGRDKGYVTQIIKKHLRR